MLSIEYFIESHSLRKTWGYYVYKGTLKYIDIEEENITKICPQFEI